MLDIEGLSRDRGALTSGAGFACPGKTTWRTFRGASDPNSIKEFTTIAIKAAELNSAIICRVLGLKEGMADTRMVEARIQRRRCKQGTTRKVMNVARLPYLPVVLILLR